MSRFTINDGLAKIRDEALRAAWWEDADYLRAVTEAQGSAALADKRLVIDFEAALARITTAGTMGEELDALLTRYLVTDYRQYGNTVPQGRDGLAHWFRTVAVHFPGSPPPPVAITAEGGLVTLALELTLPAGAPGDPATRFIITVFRVRDGMIVEHWGGGAP